MAQYGRGVHLQVGAFLFVDEGLHAEAPMVLNVEMACCAPLATTLRYHFTNLHLLTDRILGLPW